MPTLVFLIDGEDVTLDLHDVAPEYQVPQMMMLLPTPCAVESVRPVDETGVLAASVAGAHLDCRVEGIA